MSYVPLENRPKVYLCDIDGCLLRQGDKWEAGKVADDREFQELPGSVKFINEQYTAGARIILLTARPEPYRQRTEYQLQRIGLQYHELIMSLPTGQRILINDMKPQEDVPTALAINVVRDEGLGSLNIDKLAKLAA